MAKLFKRGKIWFARVPKRGGGTRRVSTLCTDKRAAEAALAQLEREAVDPAFAAANQATTQRVLDEYYLSRQRLGRSDGTLHHVRVKVAALLGLLPEMARDVTHPLCERYIDKRLSEGAMRTTVKKELRVLKAALRLARKNGLFSGEPDAIIPELDDDYEPRKRALTPWELVGLCSALPSPRAAHVAAIVALGARWSESLAIGRLEMRDALRTGLMPLHGTKTKSSDRVVPLVGASRTVLAWSLARMLGVGFSRWGNVRRDLAVACERAGIAPVTPNDLRRTFATWLRNSGVEPQLVGAAMGHTDSRMVERVYGRLQPEALASLLAARVGGSLMGAASDGSETFAADGAELIDANESQNADDSAEIAVRGDGIEPPTRGFSSRQSESDESSKKQGGSVAEEPPSRRSWVANGSSRSGLGSLRDTATAAASGGDNSGVTGASEVCVCKACVWLREGGSREPPTEVCPRLGILNSEVQPTTARVRLPEAPDGVPSLSPAEAQREPALSRGVYLTRAQATALLRARSELAGFRAQAWLQLMVTE